MVYINLKSGSAPTPNAKDFSLTKNVDSSPITICAKPDEAQAFLSVLHR
jgi:hypothetical protein